MAAGLGLPSKSTIDVFAVQGKQSCPIQTMNPPQRGKRFLQEDAASDNARAWRAWLHVTNSSMVAVSAFSYSRTKSGHSIQKGDRRQ